ncbi:hypothetical protein E1301_Tti003948 [Triplophysa tibetana]|uniref:Uncharacterized protein n=1 Tax=Triplophysa tibetana TaxID=1572043 RepID=A0A5A9NN50_9TELE|nr:hypothetical protein E1301_Tti003948 [Triplophysa tibetana]
MPFPWQLGDDGDEESHHNIDQGHGSVSSRLKANVTRIIWDLYSAEWKLVSTGPTSMATTCSDEGVAFVRFYMERESERAEGQKSVSPAAPNRCHTITVNTLTCHYLSVTSRLSQPNVTKQQVKYQAGIRSAVEMTRGKERSSEMLPSLVERTSRDPWTRTALDDSST